MATQASDVRMKTGRIRQRRSSVRLSVVHGGKELTADQGNALILSASARIRARQLERRLEQSFRRNEAVPERHSVAKAMLAVEERLVKAFWTIARQPIPVNATAPRHAARNGVDYFPDAGMDSLARFVDAAGGKWDSVAPRPSLPSSRAIDDANAALDWLLLIDDETLRKLLVVGATSKRGDAGRRISWERLRPSLPQYADVTTRTLQRKYAEALRIIVSELTLARMSLVSHKSISNL